MIEDILKDEEIRNWIWWTVIPLSVIWGLVIVSCTEKLFDRKFSRKDSKYAKRKEDD